MILGPLAVTLVLSSVIATPFDDIIVKGYAGKKAVDFGTAIVKRAELPATTTKPALGTAAANVGVPNTNTLANKADGVPNTKVDLLGRPLAGGLLIGGGVGLGGGIIGGGGGGFGGGAFGGFGIAGGIGGILGGGIGGIGVQSCQTCIGITCINWYVQC